MKATILPVAALFSALFVAIILTALLQQTADQPNSLLLTTLLQIDATTLGFIIAASLLIGQVAARNNPLLLAGSLSFDYWLYLTLFVSIFIFHFGVATIPLDWSRICLGKVCVSASNLRLFAIFLFFLNMALLVPYSIRLTRQLRPDASLARIRKQCRHERNLGTLKSRLREVEASIRGAHALGQPHAIAAGLHSLGRIAAEWLVMPPPSSEDEAGFLFERLELIRRQLRTLGQTFVLEPFTPMTIVGTYKYICIKVIQLPFRGNTHLRTTSRKIIFNYLNDLFYLGEEAILAKAVPTVPRVCIGTLRDLALQRSEASYGFGYKAPATYIFQLAHDAWTANRPLAFEDGVVSLIYIATEAPLAEQKRHAMKRLRGLMKFMLSHGNKYTLRFDPLRKISFLAERTADSYFKILFIRAVGESVASDSVLTESETLRAVMTMVASVTKNSNDAALHKEVMTMIEDHVQPAVEELEGNEESIADLKLSLLGALISSSANAGAFEKTGDFLAQAADAYDELGPDAQLGYSASSVGSRLQRPLT